MTTNHFDHLRYVLFGIVIGTAASLWLDRHKSDGIYFVKDHHSVFPLAPDEYDILIKHMNHRGSIAPNSNERCLYFPSHWNFADMEMQAICNMHPRLFHSRFIAACLFGHDRLACKGTLARLAKQFLDPTVVSAYLPISWTLEEYNSIKNETRPDDLLIAKTNLQRQVATTIFSAKDLPSLSDLKAQQTIILQKLLDNPLCVKQHKVTLRIYVLMYVSSTRRSLWRYSDGFVYYSEKPFDRLSQSNDAQVASGYSGRHVYDDRPLTVHELWRSLGPDISRQYSGDIDKCLRETIGTLMMNQNVIKDVKIGSFQLFGCDIFIKDMTAKSASTAVLLEVNKAPDLTYKSERDGQLKRGLVQNMWQLLSQGQLLDLGNLSISDEVQDSRMWLTL